MDHRRRRILVVARNSRTADRVRAWLEECRCDTDVVATFAQGKAGLESHPDLLVAEIKLGEYNGLHLGLKAEAAGVPVILIGPADVVLQKDAEGIHATYLTGPTRADLIEAVETALGATSPAGDPALPFRARVTTVAEEAETMWRAFSESPSSQLSAFGRTMLPI